MQNRTRERAGLAIFLVLVALGGILLGAYFFTGRSWSVAATMVDDTVGSLDRYTVVAFAGVVEPEEDDASGVPGAAGPPRADSAAGSSSAEAAPQASSAASSASSSSSAPGGALAPEFTMEDAFAGSSDAAEAGIRESILSVFEREDRKREAGDDTVYVSDVRDLYSLKGADGLSLNLAEADRYAEPSVLNAGGKRIGVFSVSSYLSRAKLKATLGLLREEGAEAVICIAPRTSLLSTFDGIDVVVTTTAATDAARPDERDRGETLVVESPEVGEVGVVLLSSNNVPSYKVVKEL